MSSDLWLGVLFSIPIGIGTGLAVAPVQKWIDNRSVASRYTKLKRQKREYEEVLFFASRPELLSSHLIITTLVLGCAVGLAFLFSMGEKALPIELTNTAVVRLHSTFWKATWIFIVCSSVTAMGSVLTRVVNRSIALYQHVAFFKQYAERIPPTIRNPEMEKHVRYKESS
jgi:hypothetical protein